MAEPIRWLALGYSVPVNPSKNRVYVWRKLKEYGAEYFKQGVALLPYNRQSYTKFKSFGENSGDGRRGLHCRDEVFGLPRRA